MNTYREEKSNMDLATLHPRHPGACNLPITGEYLKSNSRLRASNVDAAAAAAPCTASCGLLDAPLLKVWEGSQCITAGSPNSFKQD